MISIHQEYLLYGKMRFTYIDMYTATYNLLLQVAVFKDGKPLSERLDVSLELVEIECRNGTGLQTWFSKGGTAEVELGMEVLREEGLGKNTEEEYGACTGDEAKCEDRHRL